MIISPQKIPLGLALAAAIVGSILLLAKPTNVQNNKENPNSAESTVYTDKESITLKTKTSHTISDVTQAPLDQPIKTSFNPNPIAQQEETQEEVFSVDEQHTNQFQAATIKSVDQLFDEEPKDPFESREQENRYLDIFMDVESLSEYTLVDIKCKTTLCRLEVAITDSQQYYALTNNLIKALFKDKGHTPPTGFSIHAPSGDGQAFLYISQSPPL